MARYVLFSQIPFGFILIHEYKKLNIILVMKRSVLQNGSPFHTPAKRTILLNANYLKKCLSSMFSCVKHLGGIKGQYL
jgi:hypothetical protein